MRLFLSAIFCLQMTYVSLAGPNESFESLMDGAWQHTLEQSPEFATSLGYEGYAHRWSDPSVANLEKHQKWQKGFLKDLEAIQKDGLSQNNQLNYQLLLYKTRRSVSGHKFPNHLLAIDQLGGIQTFPVRVIRRQPASSVEDYKAIIQRLNHLPQLIQEHQKLLELGLAKGVTPPRVTLERVSTQIQALVTPAVEKHPLYDPFTRIPPKMSDKQAKELQLEAKKAIKAVKKAYGDIHKYFVSTYIKKAREKIAFTSLPDGNGWYQNLVESYTTTTMSMTAIHQTGLKEVARIRKEMKKIMKRVGFKGSLQDFLHHLRTHPDFFFTKKEDLLRGYRAIAKEADYHLPKYFGFLPRLPYGVQEIPEYAAPAAPTAYYLSGSLKNGRPGIFQANTYDLKSRPKWGMTALTLHEAVPGHHLQIAIAQELEGLPPFRKHGGYTAFSEGWGLYAESLGYDMGMYEDPYQHFGALSYEIWRSIRLVVDTGLHSKGWSRKKAIDYFLENSSLTKHDATVEVDRYIVMPAQALAYKIGELKLQELRRYAESKLGQKFQLRSFHDEVLGAGALPLDVLEKRVKDWVAQMGKSS